MDGGSIMQYILTITHDDTASIWPDLADYNDISFSKVNNAKFALNKAAYEAIKGRSLLDRPAGRKFHNWASMIDLKSKSEHVYIFAGLTFKMEVKDD
jgi:hypothetical protein